MDDALTVLRQEFGAADGTFLLQVRSFHWDRAAFTRLEVALREVAAESSYVRADSDRLPQWLAEGFYLASHSVTEWTSHPDFHRPEPRKYYEDCLTRLRDLADWYFRGFHSYQEPHDWVDL